LYGAITPFPNGLDPLGFHDTADYATLKRYREVSVAALENNDQPLFPPFLLLPSFCFPC